MSLSCYPVRLLCDKGQQKYDMVRLLGYKARQKHQVVRLLDDNG